MGHGGCIKPCISPRPKFRILKGVHFGTRDEGTAVWLDCHYWTMQNSVWAQMKQSGLLKSAYRRPIPQHILILECSGNNPIGQFYVSGYHRPMKLLRLLPDLFLLWFQKESQDRPFFLPGLSLVGKFNDGRWRISSFRFLG